MLAIPALRATIARLDIPRIAVSPLVSGKALKGPTDKLMRELNLTPGNAAIADFYDGLIDGLAINRTDADDVASLEGRGIACLVTNTVMQSDTDRLQLANETLVFAAELNRH